MKTIIFFCILVRKQGKVRHLFVCVCVCFCEYACIRVFDPYVYVDLASPNSIFDINYYYRTQENSRLLIVQAGENSILRRNTHVPQSNNILHILKHGIHGNGDAFNTEYYHSVDIILSIVTCMCAVSVLYLFTPYSMWRWWLIHRPESQCCTTS